LRTRDRLRSLFTLKENPHRLAISFAVGAFIGISPILGLHTLLGIFICYLFRLNMVAMMTGVYITNPWTMIPIYTFTTWVGTKLMGIDFVRADLNLTDLRLSNFVSELEYLLKPFLLGSFLVAAVGALLFYFLIYLVARRAQTGK
jgi:uncharacterized protein (DUF2062 family)